MMTVAKLELHLFERSLRSAALATCLRNDAREGGQIERAAIHDNDRNDMKRILPKG